MRSRPCSASQLETLAAERRYRSAHGVSRGSRRICENPQPRSGDTVAFGPKSNGDSLFRRSATSVDAPNNFSRLAPWSQLCCGPATIKSGITRNCASDVLQYQAPPIWQVTPNRPMLQPDMNLRLVNRRALVWHAACSVRPSAECACQNGRPWARD